MVSSYAQTLSVQGSTDGSSFSTIKASAGYTFDPNANNNTVTLTFSAATARYVRVNIIANTGWNAAQLSDFGVFPSDGGSSNATLSTSPTSLSYPTQALNTTSSAQPVTVTNTGTAAATVSGISVTGDFADQHLRDVDRGERLLHGERHVQAHRVRHPHRRSQHRQQRVERHDHGRADRHRSRHGEQEPGSGRGHHQVQPHRRVPVAVQRDRRQPGHLLGERRQRLPQWVQVDLGSAQRASSVVLQLPAGWGARNQTLSLSGSTDGSSFTTIKPSATYTFDPTTNNTVTITFTATTQRYVRVNITANNGWPVGCPVPGLEHLTEPDPMVPPSAGTLGGTDHRKESRWVSHAESS